MRPKIVLASAIVMAWAVVGLRARAADSNGNDVEARWDLRADTSYASSGNFQGWGVAARGAWLPRRYLALGASVETTGLHADGTIPTVAFSQSFRSTLLAGFAQARLPLRVVTPYLELALGQVSVSQGEQTGSQCSYHGGFGVGVAAGADLSLSRSLSVGLRASTRNPGYSLGCAAQAGPWSFEFSWVRALAGTVAYRF
jgi:hypothetical protein